MGSGVLSDLTFYRLPDANATANNVAGVLEGIYNSLTSSTDYRGTSLPNTHKWTWATASVGVINAIYNTSLPSGSTANNFAILIAGTGSAAGTMLSPQTDAIGASIKTGLVLNPGAYSNWTSNDPMTSGWFPGYWKYVTGATFTTSSTYVRSYVSQESIFIRMFQAGVVTNQYLVYLGAIYEPFVAYTSSYNYTSDTDSRILGMISTGASLNSSTFVNTNATNAFLWNNTADNQSACCAIRSGNPAYSIGQVQRTTNPPTVAVNTEKDYAGNFIFDEIIYYNINSLVKVGTLRSVYPFGTHTANTNTIRSGSTDLYHLVSYNPTVGSQTIALKAAP